jgi:nitrite reductase/ring-hydroxylating ferredoxin subunit
MTMAAPDFEAVMRLADLPQGRMSSCIVSGREIVICHTRDGVFALDNICTHAYACLTQGRLQGTRLVCPLHGAAFDVRDGRALSAPAQRPLIAYAVRLVDGIIEVAVDAEAPPQSA